MSFHTVRDFSAFGSSAASAFSSGDRDQKRADTAAAAEKKAYEAYVKKLADEKAAKEHAQAVDFTSLKSYPSLGSTTAPVPVKKPVLNFSRTVATMAEKEKEREKAVAPSFIRSRPTRPVHPNYYEEDNQQMTYAGDEDDDDGEFNADLVSNRRRGDKGVW
jgi:hypothetical protein